MEPLTTTTSMSTRVSAKRITIHDLPPDQRPRERLLAHGAKSLSTTELLCILLGKGTASAPVMDVAQSLVARFGDLGLLAEASTEQLQQIPGVGQVKACTLLAAVELADRMQQQTSMLKAGQEKIAQPREVVNLVRRAIRDWKKECYWVVSLNSRDRVVGVDEVSVGTIDAALVHPRETFLAAIRRTACRIIVCHNHPSGDPTPSEDDLLVTKRLTTAGKIIGIQVVDHIIVSRDDFYSLEQHQQMK